MKVAVLVGSGPCHFLYVLGDGLFRITFCGLIALIISDLEDFFS